MKRILFFASFFLLLCIAFQTNALPVRQEDNRRSVVRLEQSDSLFAAGVELYRQGMYAEAIPYFEKSDRIDKAVLDSASNRRDYSAMWLASCYYRLGDSVKAKSIHEYYRFAPVDRRLTVKSDSLSAVGIEYYNQGEYVKALDCFLACAEIEKGVVGEEHPFYANTIIPLAYTYFFLQDSVNAVKMQLRHERLIRSIFGKQSIQYIYALCNSGDLYNAYSEHEKSLKYYQQTLALTDSMKLFNGDITDSKVVELRSRIKNNLAVSFNNEAVEQFKKGNYTEAIRLGTEVMNIRKEILGTNHPDYATSLNNLALYYSDLGNYTEAIRLGTEAMNIQEEILGTNHPHYATSLSNLTGYNSSLGNYAEAIRLETEAMNIRKEILGTNHPVRLGTEAMNIRKEVLGINHPDYATSLSNLAGYNSSLGNYAEAIRLETEAMNIRKEILGTNHPVRLETEAMNIRKEILGTNHPDYATSLNNLALYYSDLGNYTEAIRLVTEAMNILKEILGISHPHYATSLNNLALYYSGLGNYTEAIRLGTEAMNIWKEILGTNHPDYAASLSNLAGYNSSLGNYAEAIRLGTEAMNIWKEILGTNHPDYATSLSNLALYYSDLGNYTEAIRLGTKAMNIRKKILGINHPDCATSLNNLATYSYYLGNYMEAIRLMAEAVDVLKDGLGTYHPNYAISLESLAVLYFRINNERETVSLYIDVTNLYTDLVLSTFADLTISEQALFWNKYNNYFNSRLPQCAYTLADDSLYASAYNGILLGKGLLLNAEMEMKNLLQESGDSAIVALYEETRMNRLMLNKLWEKPVNEQFMDADSLQQVIKRQEQELIQRSKVYGDYTKNLAITWQDVQKKLGKEDVALEFLSFPTGQDSLMYVAMVVKPSMEHPEMIPLFEEKQLKRIQPYSYYTTSELYQLVWKPLEEKLQGVKNIYFAPGGELYNIAVETLPDTDSTFISDRYSLYRLSSTRQLALIQEGYDSGDARIYGGLKYDTGLSALVRDNRKYHRANSSLARSFEDTFIADSLQMRSGAEELPGTKIEAENIKRSLDAARVSNELYTDTVGTEASFKAMSGERIRTLHIATHGFYWTEREARQLKDLDFLMLADDRNPKYTEDKALTRSGLLMAGANNALMGLELPEDVDNGILTAKEIAGLDLRGMDMVVLSACQTGLGEITGDGVFGLQRGFKKAGAKSLLMSLWKVEDNATQLLMTRFYANLITGMGKHEALLNAQRYVREYEKEIRIVVNEVTSDQKRQMERQGIRWEPKFEIRKEYPYRHPRYWAAFILLDGLN